MDLQVQERGVELVADPDRLDWWLIPETVLRAHSLQHVPGIFSRNFNGKKLYRIHRSHLPLLPIDSIGASGSSPDDAAAFDRGTEKLGWKLREYQHAARRFIRDRAGTLLADTMRLGKSAVAVASHDESWGQFIVVGPLSSRAVWLGWMKRRWPGIEPAVVLGRSYDPKKLEESQLVFMHYDVLPSWQKFGRDIGTAVFDEVHLCSNRRSLRARAAGSLAVQAKKRIALSGTPLWNRPADLWPILQLVTGSAFGSFTDFSWKYCEGHKTVYGWKAEGVSNEIEFRLRLGQVMIRRTWEEVQKELPPIERTVEVVDPTPAEMLEIEKELGQIKRSRISIGEMAQLRLLLGQLKVKQAVALARRFIMNGESSVVWTWHKDVAYRIGNELNMDPWVKVLTGDVSIAARERAIKEWQESKEPMVLVVTISVGQVALDFSKARHCIFAEQSWTPAEISQAEMRVFSPLRPMSATHLVLDHPIDRAVVKTVLGKIARAEKLGVPCSGSALDVLEEALDVVGEVELADLFNLEVGE